MSFGWHGRPTGEPFQIYLNPGDTIIMPAGTVHEVVTGPTEPHAFVSGCMFTPSQNVKRQTQCMLAEAWADHQITNEEPSIEIVTKTEKWFSLMKEGRGDGVWPCADDQALVERYIKVTLHNDFYSTMLTTSTDVEAIRQ